MTESAEPFPPGRRVLFLDDDPGRGMEFLAWNPGAVWVETVESCLAHLTGPVRWDEVHLDHDLGGEQFVGPDRDDCGMAVVRWLCEAPRPHLQDTLFIIHSHNTTAAASMTLHLRATGYRVREAPFGTPPPFERSSPPTGALAGLWRRLFSRR